VPRRSHRLALSKICEKIVSHLKLAHDPNKKTFTILDEKIRASPAIGVDWHTFAGGHGFSTLFSRKQETDPNPLLPCFMLITEDKVDTRDFSAWKDLLPDPTKLDKKTCLYMLYRASYTVPSPDAIQYKTGVLEMAQVSFH